MQSFGVDTATNAVTLCLPHAELNAREHATPTATHQLLRQVKVRNARRTSAMLDFQWCSEDSSFGQWERGNGRLLGSTLLNLFRGSILITTIATTLLIRRSACAQRTTSLLNVHHHAPFWQRFLLLRASLSCRSTLQPLQVKRPSSSTRAPTSPWSAWEHGSLLLVRSQRPSRAPSRAATDTLVSNH